MQLPLQHAFIRLAGPQKSVLIVTGIPLLLLYWTLIADLALVLNASWSTGSPCKTMWLYTASGSHALKFFRSMWVEK